MERRKIDYFEFRDRFKPLLNQYEELVDVDPRVGALSHEDFRQACEERRIWTLIDGDENEPQIVSGLHFVNRLEHYLCEVPVEEGVEYEEELDD